MSNSQRSLDLCRDLEQRIKLDDGIELRYSDNELPDGGRRVVMLIKGNICVTHSVRASSTIEELETWALHTLAAWSKPVLVQ